MSQHDGLPEEFIVQNLREMKVLMPRDLADDHVLLFARTDKTEITLRLHREDFIELARYLSSDAAELQKRN